jgi:hypothetical protein
MYKKISKSSEIIDRLQKEGKVTPMNSPEYMAKIASTNKYMEEVRRDYRNKECQSIIAASLVVLSD